MILETTRITLYLQKDPQALAPSVLVGDDKVDSSKKSKNISKYLFLFFIFYSQIFALTCQNAFDDQAFNPTTRYFQFLLEKRVLTTDDLEKISEERDLFPKILKSKAHISPIEQQAYLDGWKKVREGVSEVDFEVLITQEKKVEEREKDKQQKTERFIYPRLEKPPRPIGRFSGDPFDTSFAFARAISSLDENYTLSISSDSADEKLRLGKKFLLVDLKHPEKKSVTFKYAKGIREDHYLKQFYFRNGKIVLIVSESGADDRTVLYNLTPDDDFSLDGRVNPGFRNLSQIYFDQLDRAMVLGLKTWEVNERRIQIIGLDNDKIEKEIIVWGLENDTDLWAKENIDYLQISNTTYAVLSHVPREGFQKNRVLWFRLDQTLPDGFNFIERPEDFFELDMHFGSILSIHGFEKYHHDYFVFVTSEGYVVIVDAEDKKIVASNRIFPKINGTHAEIIYKEDSIFLHATTTNWADKTILESTIQCF